MVINDDGNYALYKPSGARCAMVCWCGGFDIGFSMAASSWDANVKSETTLESGICWCSYGSDIRKRTRRDRIEMLESKDH